MTETFQEMHFVALQIDRWNHVKVTTEIFKEMHQASVSIIASILDNTVAARMDV